MTASDDPHAGGDAAPTDSLQGFQQEIEVLYGTRDRERGLDGTFVWLIEEVGELARALKGDDPVNLREEFADVLAWLTTLASLADVDMRDAARKYDGGCPRCSARPCECPRKRSQRKS